MKNRDQIIGKCAIALLLVSAGVFGSGCATDSGSKSSRASVGETEYLSAAEARKDPDRVICRRHKPTGSRISEKICMTARQWQQASDESARLLDRAQRAPQAGLD